MEPFVSYLATFLAGALSGAAGQYLAARFTEQRKATESKSAFKRKMVAVRTAMPELIEEMIADFNSESGLTVREIVLLPNDRVTFNSNKQRFVYFEAAHKNLRGKLDILEQNELIYDVTPGNTPIYRVTEEFHAFLRSR